MQHVHKADSKKRRKTAAKSAKAPAAKAAAKKPDEGRKADTTKAAAKKAAAPRKSAAERKADREALAKTEPLKTLPFSLDDLKKKSDAAPRPPAPEPARTSIDTQTMSDQGDAYRR